MILTSSTQKLWPFSRLVPLEIPMFSIETYRKKETALILKCIDQLPQNLARVHYLVRSFDRCHKNFKRFYSSYCFHCFLLFIYCLSFDPTLMEQVLKKCLYQHFEQLPGNFSIFFCTLRNFAKYYLHAKFQTNWTIQTEITEGGWAESTLAGHTNLQNARPV